MQDFIFHNPVKIIFGKGKTQAIGEEARKYGKKALLLYGKGSIKKNGIYDRVTSSLQKAGVDWTDCSGVKSNPTLSFVIEGIRIFKKFQLDSIIAVGGGSVIDTAKAIAAGVKYDGDVWDFCLKKAFVQNAIPIAVVLTLAASASEMNSGCVITNEKTMQKLGMGGEPLYPKVSILDPENTYSVPQHYTMYGAVDILVHVLEPYFNYSAPYTPIQDRLVEAIVKTVLEEAPKLEKKPNNYSARANLMWAATLGLNDITSAGVGCTGFPCHMMEHALSAIYDIAHGAGLAIVLPAWMKYSYKKNTTKFAQLAERIFSIRDEDIQVKAYKGIKALEEWFKGIAVPIRLSEIDISKDDIPKIAKNALTQAKLWHLKEYPLEVIKEVFGLSV